MRTCAMHIFLLFCLLFMVGGCEPKTEIPLDTKEVFFNANMLEGILDVEEAQRPKYLEQFKGKSISGRGRLLAVSEAIPSDEYARYGKYELLASAPNMFRDIGVEYRVYVEEALGKDLFHKRIPLAFTGTVLQVEWSKAGDHRTLRVFLTGDKVESLSE